MASKFRVALVQLAVSACKNDNISRATSLIKEAATAGAKIVALPECFNSPYGTKYFPDYAEKIPGPSTDALASAARQNKVFVVGGSIPEIENGNYYNTCTVYNPEGSLVAKHRKVHLFDIDIPGKITFTESEILSPGNQLTTFDTEFCKIGIGICYDIRFPELALLYAKKGCRLILYPGAFNMTTGPAHWELLQRGRALDNQVYVATISPARDEKATYIAWGHSTMVNPWGEVIATTEDKEAIVYSEIDLEFAEQVAEQIPISYQKRGDLYRLEDLSTLDGVE